MRLLRAISRLRNVLEGSIKARTESLYVNFHISNEGVYTLDVELRDLVLKLRRKCSFPIKVKEFIKAQIESFKVNFLMFHKKIIIFMRC